MSTPGNIDVDVVVVGAGISGLATAFDLQRRGLAVDVLDAATRAGGVIGTMHRDGALVETGPNSALDTTPRINELLDALGIRNERAEANAAASTRYVVRGGRLLPLPTSPGAFLATSAFTPGAKFRLWREPFVPPAPPDVEESVATFVRRRLGTEFLDYAIDPFVAGIYAGDPERISVSAAFPRLHALEQKYGSLIKGQFQGARERRRAAGKAANAAGSFSFRNGMQTLTDALARAIDRRHDRRDHRATRAGCRRQLDHWRARAAANPSCGTREASCLPLRRTRRPSSCASSLRPRRKVSLAIPYAAIASIATVYRRADIAHSLAGFGFLVPRREQRKLLGCLFSSSMFDGRTPDGTVLLTSFVGGERHPELPAGSDAQLAAIVHGDLQALLGARGDPEWTAITRWTHAIPQYNLGHRERLRPVEDAERALPGLFFCASYRGGVSVGDRIQSAHAMADAVARFLGP